MVHTIYIILLCNDSAISPIGILLNPAHTRVVLETTRLDTGVNLIILRHVDFGFRTDIAVHIENQFELIIHTMSHNINR